MSGPVQGVGYGGNDPRERRGAGQVSDAAIGDGLEKVDGRVRLKLDPKSALSITPRGELSVEQAEQGAAAGGSAGTVFFRDVLQSGVETTGATLEDVIDAEVELLKRKSQASGYPSLDATIHVPGLELGTGYAGAGTLVLTDSTPPSWLPVGSTTVTVSQTDRLLGRDSAGAGAVEELSITPSLEFTGALGIQRAALTGDVTATAGANATTIANDAVTYAKIQNVTDARVLGRAAGSAGDVQELSAGTGVTIAAGTISATGSGGTVTSVSGTAPISVATGTTTPVISLDDGGVTFAKFQDISNDVLVGRHAVGSGDAEEISLDGTLEFSGSAALGRASITGDVDIPSGGNASSIANDAVTYAKIQNVTDARVLGRAAGSSGDVEELSAGTGVTISAGTISATGSGGTVTNVTGTAPIAVATGTTTPVVSLNDDGVTFAKMQEIATDRLIGRDTAGTGNPEEISLGASLEFSGSASIQRAALTGDVTAAANGNATTIAADAVTFAKFQDIATARVLGRTTAGSGDVEELSAGTGITIAAGTISASGGAGTVTSVSGTAPISVATGTTTPVISLDADGVTFAFMQEIATDRLIGRDTAATGNPEELTVTGGVEFTGAGGIQRSALTGDVTATAGSNATTIANDAVTYAKIQNVTTARVLGRTTAGSGDVEELSAGTGVTIAGGTISATGSGGTVTSVSGTAPISVATGTTTPVVSLDDDGVTFAKIQNIATARVLGRTTAASGDVEELSAGTGIAISGGTISATGGVAPAAHATTHQHGGSDEVAVAIPAANGIPKADGTGKLSAGWISETLALSGLSDVTAKTGTGTIVVMDTSPTIVTPVIASFVTAQHNHSSAATGGAIVAASTTVAGVIEIATDGEASATTAVVGTDNRLLTLIDTSQRSVRSVLSSPGVGVPFVAATAYFVYLGRVTKTTTFGFVRWLIRSAASGAQVAECGFFSSPTAPSRVGQTLTKLAATGTLSNLTVTGPASNSTTLAASIPAGTHLWSGIRMNMGTSQGSAYGLLQDQGQGRVLSTAGAGTLTAGTTFVGALITDTGIALCAGIEATLD